MDTYTEITSQWCSDTETGEIQGMEKTFCSKTHKVLSSRIVTIKPGQTKQSTSTTD